MIGLERISDRFLNRISDRFGPAYAYGIIDAPLALRLHRVAAARVENFRQQVDILDPFAHDAFGTIDETDIFPAVNLLRSVENNQTSASSSARPCQRLEFREAGPPSATPACGSR